MLRVQQLQRFAVCARHSTARPVDRLWQPPERRQVHVLSQNQADYRILREQLYARAHHAPRI